MRVLVQHLGLQDRPAPIKESDKIIEDLGADSLDTVELVMAFEQEFSIEIPDTVSETIVTAGNAIDTVYGALKAKGKAA